MDEDFVIRPMTLADYPAVRALWEAEPGIKVSAVDAPAAIERLLLRCPGLSLVATRDGAVVGGVLASEDTRRGYIHHLVVAPAERRRGLGAALMREVERRFVAAGIPRLHLFVMKGNDAVVAFYEKLGWFQRHDLTMLSRDPGA